ncbi:hypothetical protein P8452_31211 [Trifolium repens]|nr:hypothetical protein P8452_31211 [Trifolium repens]
METSRNSSLTIAFLLAFLIIASDMHMGTQARKVSEVLKADCYSDADCKRRCSPLIGTCEADMHMGVQVRKMTEELKADCYSDGDCKSRCSPLPGTCEAGLCICVHLQPTST